MTRRDYGRQYFEDNTKSGVTLKSQQQTLTCEHKDAVNHHISICYAHTGHCHDHHHYYYNPLRVAYTHIIPTGIGPTSESKVIPSYPFQQTHETGLEIRRQFRRQRGQYP
jgi:hypothetical protein